MHPTDSNTTKKNKKYPFHENSEQDALLKEFRPDQLYEMLFNEIDEGFCIIEMLFDEKNNPADYRFLEVNPAFEKHTGLKDASGKRMRELAPKHEEHWFTIYGEVALTGKPVHFVNCAEQLHRWYDVHAFRFGKPENRQVAILFSDITERKKQEEELRYRAEMVAQISDGVSLIRTNDGILIHTSRRFEEMFGYEHNELPGKHISVLNAPDSNQNAHEVTKNIMKTVAEVGKWKGVVHNVRKDGSFFWSQASVSPIVHPQFGNVLLTIQMDISERMEAEKALRENESRQAAMIANISDVIAIIDKNGIIRFKSPNVEKWFGWKSNEMFGKKMFRYIHPDDIKQIITKFDTLLANPEKVIHAECRYQCKDQSYKWIKITAVNRLNDKNINGILINYHNITRQKQASEMLVRHEKELKLLSSALINVHEKEKKKLAQELHDEIGQLLTAMKMNLAVIHKKTEETDKVTKERVQETNQLLDNILSRVHEISLNLRPGMLDVLGFVSTVKSYGQQFQKRTGIHFHFTNNSKTKPASEQEIHLFRIIQEALTNTAKYAKAQNVMIALDSNKKWYSLSIQDDGVGFNTGDTNNSNFGIGIIGMNERVISMQGKIQITSDSPNGTKIKIKVPLNDER